MNLKKARKLFLTLLLAMVILPFLLSRIFPSLYPLWLVLLAVLCAAALFVMLKFWRCPRCGKGLGNGVPKYCPSYGHKLDDLQ